MKPQKITVEPPVEHPEILDVRDAMQQVLDYFDLLTDQGQADVVWSLVFASTNSPFTAEGSPVNVRTNAPAFGQVRDHVAKIERGLVRMEAGERLDDDFPAEKRDVALKFLKRNTNGIGRTILEFGDGASVELRPETARRSLDVLQGVGDEEYDYFFASFARKEYGSIEGRILDLSTDYDEPSIKLKEHRSGREIQCRISAEARDEIESNITAGDVWTHRRVRVRGLVSYDPNGKIVRVYDGRIAFLDSKEVKISDIHDPNFTAGMPIYQYIDKLRENEIG